jgi:hypothetical protein
LRRNEDDMKIVAGITQRDKTTSSYHIK